MFSFFFVRVRIEVILEVLVTRMCSKCIEATPKRDLFSFTFCREMPVCSTHERETQYFTDKMFMYFIMFLCLAVYLPEIFIKHVVMFSKTEIKLVTQSTKNNVLIKLAL